MLRLASILILPLALAAADDWTFFRSGPFEVYSAGGIRAGRLALNELEQVRNGLRQTLGADDLVSTWPIRLVVFDSERDARGYPLSAFRLSRDAWMGAIVKNNRTPVADLVRILLDANTQRMPPSTENGLLAVFSTIDIDRTVVVLGEPVPESQQDENWATMHLLTVSPDYGGRAPVFFSNLQQGADWFAAYGNAFGKRPEEIQTEAAAYLARGDLPTRKLSGAPINPERDFRALGVDEIEISIVLADLFEGEAAKEAYEAVLAAHPGTLEALEGLGRYADAVAAGSKSARCHLAYGLTLDDHAKARDALRAAAELNPRWGEPHFRLAMLEGNPAQKSRLLTQATELDPRNVDCWKQLALTYLSTDSYREAGRAWAGAESAAVDEAERERIREARRIVEQQRADFLAEQRRLEREKREAELARLEEEMLDRIRAAEEAANASDPEAPEGRKIVEWWDDPRPKQQVSGTLERVDCLRGSARLLIRRYDGDTISLSVPNTEQIVILGGGEQTLACGPQDPPRNVAVEYFVAADQNQDTAGEVAAIDFR